MREPLVVTLHLPSDLSDRINVKCAQDNIVPDVLLIKVLREHFGIPERRDSAMYFNLPKK